MTLEEAAKNYRERHESHVAAESRLDRASVEVRSANHDLVVVKAAKDKALEQLERLALGLSETP